MTADEHHGATGPTGGLAASSPAAPFLAALAQADEATKLRLLADLVGELAEQASGTPDRFSPTEEIEGRATVSRWEVVLSARDMGYRST